MKIRKSKREYSIKTSPKDYVKGTIVQVKNTKDCKERVRGQYAVVVRHNRFDSDLIVIDYYDKSLRNLEYHEDQTNYKNLRIVA